MDQNSAFISHRRGFLQPSHRNSDRFQTPQDFVGDLGPHGLCCVLFITEDTTYTPIAYAGVKPYKEHFNWEWKAMRTILDRGLHFGTRSLTGNCPAWSFRMTRDMQGKGFAARCCAEVESALVNPVRDEWSKQQDDRGMSQKITIWIQAVCELAGAYWSKRGYQEVSVNRVGAGGWGAAQPFDLVTGKKELAL